MPPVKRLGIKVEVDDQGRTVHTFRQSTLGELDLCPERGRLTLTGIMPKLETDAAALGSAGHFAIEAGLHALKTEGPLSPARLLELAEQEFDRISGLEGFVYKKYRRSRVSVLLKAVVDRFYEEIYAEIDPVGVEVPFNALTIYEDEQRVIRINGTIDLVDRNKGPCDWKTAGDGRKYKRGWGGEGWQLDRWGIQPTVYTEACLQLGLLDPEEDEWPFTFFAFELSGDVELHRLTVYRHRGDLEWLKQKCLSYALLVEAEATVWPKQDNHALCSEMWCPAWSMCKGQNYLEGWPKPSAPAAHITEQPVELRMLL